MDTVKALVLSDTHVAAATLERIPHEVWAMADEADVVLHAGDVVNSALLAALGERAPVHAVLGNNDRELAGALPETLELELGGVRLALVHDSGPRRGRGDRLRRRFPDAAVVVFGHSHEPIIDRLDDGLLLVNPGSPTQRRRQPVHTVAWLELRHGAATAELIEVGPFRRGSE